MKGPIQSLSFPFRMAAIGFGAAVASLVSGPISAVAAPPGDTHTPPYQSFISGNELLQACEAASAQEDPAGCSQYIAGVVDEYALVSASLNIPRTFCLARNITSKQLGRVTLKWLNEHPNTLHFIASSLVVQSLTESFPCKGAH